MLRWGCDREGLEGVVGQKLWPDGDGANWEIWLGRRFRVGVVVVGAVVVAVVRVGGMLQETEF
jgi:hypothetical protein